MKDTGNPPAPRLKVYAIDEQVRGSYTNHNGHSEAISFWKEICQMKATRLSNAARVVERKWGNKTLRVRLINQVRPLHEVLIPCN